MSISGENNTKLNHILTQLKPYTQYAFYVKTYTIATEAFGAQSNIQYFRTLPDGKSIIVLTQSAQMMIDASCI